MSERDLLMIPGPIEFDPAVLRAMARPTLSHVSPEFIEIFGSCLEDLRRVFLAPDGQPVVVAGTGTLAMELVSANLVEQGDDVLIVNTGYFGNRMASAVIRAGGQATNLEAEVGGAPSVDDVKDALSRRQYKLVAVTQVDTSTGVLVDVEGIARLTSSAGALLSVDGVCATAGEQLRQTDWGVDVCVTASQKAIGVPPGLALGMFGPRAIAAFESRKSPVRSFYADLGEWLPVLKAYEARKPAYFGTPAVNLTYALRESLNQILAEGMDARFARHHRMATAVRAGLKAIGLQYVPKSDAETAHTMSAIYYPEGITAGLVGGIKGEGVVVATGLHPEIRASYFRIGHMGAVNASDVLATVGAVERALWTAGYRFDVGAGVAAAQKALVAAG